MKHQVNLYSFLAYHRGPWVQALCALDSFWGTQSSIPWSHFLLSASSIHYRFLVLSLATAIKFMKLYTNSNSSWCAVLMLHLLICDFWCASSASIMSKYNTGLDKAPMTPIHQNPIFNYTCFCCISLICSLFLIFILLFYLQ